MAHGLSDGGEETYNKSGIDGLGLEVALYDDSVDALSDSDSDPAFALGTEPGDGNYTREAHTVATGDISQISGNWGFSFSVSFDVSGTTGAVDSVCLIDSSDGTIFARHPLSGGSITLDSIDTLDVTVEGTLN